MKHSSQQTGDTGEDIAEQHLLTLGHDILQRNYRCKTGEIDRISLDRKTKTICFVEVKTRHREDVATAESSITAAKQKHLRSAARHYLKANRVQHLPHRFDVICISLQNPDQPDIRYYKDSF